MAVLSSSSDQRASILHSTNKTHAHFFVWREFLWGAIAGAFGEGMMHPIDTIKTRIQSQAFLTGAQNQKSILQMVRTVGVADGVKGFYRGIAPGVTGSLATGATYFGVIESTKKWIEEKHPNLEGHWAHFIAGALGDTLGSFVYVPCEVMKQRMQVQGTRTSWNSVIMKENACVKPSLQMYGYYSGMFQAGCSIWKEQGLKGLYAGYWSTLARDVPFAGLMVMFYEGLKDLAEHGKKKWVPSPNYHINSSVEGLVLGGLAGGLSAYLTTPLDVIKTRIQVQGSTIRYHFHNHQHHQKTIMEIYTNLRTGFLVQRSGCSIVTWRGHGFEPQKLPFCMRRYKNWFDAVHRIWMIEGPKGMFRGSVPRIIWYVPASALTFMAVEFLRDHFNEGINKTNIQEVASLSIDKKGSLQNAA